MNTSIVDPARELLPLGLTNAIWSWADASTDAISERRKDLIRDKSRALRLFFEYVNKPVELVTPSDVNSWQIELESQGKSPSTIYAMISRVSSFYQWMLESPELADKVRSNPVTLARPKPPKPYQTESTKSLTDEELRALLCVVKDRADSGGLVGKRDYALLLLFICSGLRRSEIIRLRWGDVNINGSLILNLKLKGGDHASKEVDNPIMKEALLDYLKASHEIDELLPGDPLWTRHDRAGESGKQLNSHSFAKRLKVYAKEAGIGDIHLHQLRHTFARIAAEESGSLSDVQEALNHKSLSTTRVYVQRVGVRKDKFSSLIGERLF